jgi:hypothetical protein
MDGVIGRRESFAFLRLQYPHKGFVTMKCCVKSEYPPNLSKQLKADMKVNTVDEAKFLSKQ